MGMLGYRAKQDVGAASETPRTRPEAERNSQEHVAHYPPLWGGLVMRFPSLLHPQKKKKMAANPLVRFHISDGKRFTNAERTKLCC